MRSKLFVPAIRPELFEKAQHCDADTVCFDLEDAVAHNRKAEARAYLRSFLTQPNTPASPLFLVRTNTVASDHFTMDIEACVWNSLSAIALPKVESTEEIHRAVDALEKLESSRNISRQIDILPTIESPRGLRLAHKIALSSPRIIGLQLGFADLLEPLGICTNNQFARNQIRLALRLAAGEAGLDCYDSAHSNIKDLIGYETELKSARDLGFSGTSCIHPSQVPIANRLFSANDEELAFAKRVLEAADVAARSGASVTTLDGKMIDKPFILRAQKLLGFNKL
jgi:citrate lyase subunit beta/citryl-CoA lyase